MKRNRIYITIPKYDVKNFNIDTEVHSFSGMYGDVGMYMPSSNKRMHLELRNGIYITNDNMSGMLVGIAFIRHDSKNPMFEFIQLTFNNTMYTLNPFGRFSNYIAVNIPVIHQLMNEYGTSAKEDPWIEYRI